MLNNFDRICFELVAKSFRVILQIVVHRAVRNNAAARQIRQIGHGTGLFPALNDAAAGNRFCRHFAEITGQGFGKVADTVGHEAGNFDGGVCGVFGNTDRGTGQGSNLKNKANSSG